MTKNTYINPDQASNQKIIKGLFNGIKPIKENEDFHLSLMMFCFEINTKPYNSDVISKKEYDEYQIDMYYTLKAVESDLLSSYMKKSMIQLTVLLSEAKDLNEIGLLSLSEFTMMFMTVRGKFFQKFQTVKRAYFKHLNGLNKANTNNLRKLRASFAILEEN